MKKIIFIAMACAMALVTSCSVENVENEKYDITGAIWYTALQGVAIDGEDLLVPANDHNGCGVTELFFYRDGTFIETSHFYAAGTCDTQKVQGVWSMGGNELRMLYSDDPFNPQYLYITNLARNTLRVESPGNADGVTNITIYSL